MKVVFFGTPAFAVPTLAALCAADDIEVVAVVSQPDRRRGRGKQLSPSPVKAEALTQGIPVWQPERVKRCPDTLAKLQGTQADVFVVVAYGQILSPEILAVPRLGCVNVHGSLLPAYRGAAPIQWSIANGDTETGITTMLMDAGMDTGDMLLKVNTPITLQDNFFTVGERLANVGATLLVETLQQLESKDVTPTPQSEDQATYAPLLKKEDFQIDWQRDALSIHNQVRGFYPNGVTRNKLKVLSTVPLTQELQARITAEPELVPLWQLYEQTTLATGDPGTIVAVLKNWGPVIQTGVGHLLLRTVKPAGKKAQSGWDFANGSHLQIGDYL